ncbi:MAG: hypothetical protein FWE02_06405 [Defluviitaleaceae bacterium]|nr:hypothetical protein [Defluviitaleaceae bacterium]
MARGFTGKTVERFFCNTSEALSNAAKVHDRDPFEGRSAGLVPLPILPSVSNRKVPFEAADAWSDKHPTNVGNSSNIVVDPSVGEPALIRVSSVDERAGQELYNICSMVEEMCRTIYIVPETNPRVINMCSEFKNSLGQFRTLTEEFNSCMRSFMNEAANIDMGNDGQIAKSERAAEQNISRVRTTMESQASNMERTATSYRNTAANLQQQAQREKQKAERLKNNPFSAIQEGGY